ncbi:MAG: HD domain-containing protein [Candidatus Paceibacterota bacterium]
MTNFEANSITDSINNSFETSEKNARIIAQGGDFYFIKEKLTTADLLEKEKERVKKEYQEHLDKIQFLTDSDLEMFTIIELYDKNLALHSLETFLLARSKAERPLAFNIVLIDIFATEDVTPEQFFRACFLHDVGKVYVPNFILNNEASFHEIANILNQKLSEGDNDTLANIARKTGESTKDKTKEELLQILKKHYIRPVYVVPVKYLLNEKENIVAKNSYHLNTDFSLMDIIETHEKHSGDILRQAGYEIEADLAGAHHNYHGRGSNHPKTLEALKLTIDSVELLRIADITHALGDSRSYNKTGFSKPKIWTIILEEVNAGKVSEVMAYLWLEDEVKVFEQDKNNLENLTIEGQAHLESVKKELVKMYKNISSEGETEEFMHPKAA